MKLGIAAQTYMFLLLCAHAKFKILLSRAKLQNLVVSYSAQNDGFCTLHAQCKITVFIRFAQGTKFHIVVILRSAQNYRLCWLRAQREVSKVC